MKVETLIVVGAAIGLCAFTLFPGLFYETLPNPLEAAYVPSKPVKMLARGIPLEVPRQVFMQCMAEAKRVIGGVDNEVADRCTARLLGFEYIDREILNRCSEEAGSAMVNSFGAPQGGVLGLVIPPAQPAYDECLDRLTKKRPWL